MENKNDSSTQIDAAPVKGKKAKPKRNSRRRLIQIFTLELAIEGLLRALGSLPTDMGLEKVGQLLGDCFWNIREQLFTKYAEIGYSKPRKRKSNRPEAMPAPAANPQPISPGIILNNYAELTAIAAIRPLGDRTPALTLLQPDEQVQKYSIQSYPLFAIQFSKVGAGPHVGYNAIVVDGPGNFAVPAEGPIVFGGPRCPWGGSDMHTAMDLEGMFHVMQKVDVTDAHGDRFTIAMVERFGDEPERLLENPMFLAYRGATLPWDLDDMASQDEELSAAEPAAASEAEQPEKDAK